MKPAIAESKKNLREKFFREWKGRNPPADRLKKTEAALLRHLFSLFDPAALHHVALYRPFPSEMNLSFLEQAAQVYCWQLYYPRTFSNGMIFTGPGGWMEPRRLDLVIVPGLWVAPSGIRLGRGGGFYDRLLRIVPASRTVFLCRSWQVLQALPEDPWDRRVGAIVHELGFRRCRRLTP